MNEIYKAPNSSFIDLNSIIPKPHGFWKFYFWINLALVSILLLAVFTFETVGALDCFDFLTFSFSSVALNGYAYSKKYFSSTVWKIFYVAYLFWLIFYLIIAAYILKIPQLGEVAVLDFWVSIDLVLSVLSLTAIYLYAYK
ncbi:MAG: hypothetical protein HRT88_17555, partial [Lentisphaeraceae bacterium]|nr:hypothetical protein [Lentisphaeraceae bacterium]